LREEDMIQITQDPDDIIKIEDVIKEIDRKMLQLQQKELDKINKILSIKIQIK